MSASEGFIAFWSVYPRRVGKKYAERAWLRLGPPDDALVATIVAAVQAQTPRWRERDPQYIPHPATWLHGERWNDEVVDLVPIAAPALLTKTQVRSQRNAAAAAAVIASFEAEAEA